MMMRGNWKYSDVGLLFLIFYALSFVIITLSFIPHEMGHKFVAQKYGAWSEYRKSNNGLIFAVLISLLGILIAAPGAVYIRGYITEEQNGKISAAGPIVNIIISAVSIGLMTVFTNGWLGTLFFMLAYINAMLALFNLIPIPPLDGSKIIKWSIPVWIAMLALAGVEFLMAMGLLF